MNELETNNIVFDPTAVSEELVPKAMEIMKLLDEKIFIIEKYDNPSKFEDVIWTLRNNMCYGFEHQEFRDHPVQFKFRDDPEEDVKWLPFRVFIVNLIMWYPMICFDPTHIDETFIISESKSHGFGVNEMADYIDDKYQVYGRFIPTKPDLPITELHAEISTVYAETTYMMQQTVGKFSRFYGISSSIETFHEMAKKFPEFDALMNFKLDESKQPAEMEADLDAALNKNISIVENDDDFNLLKPLVKSNALNLRQYCSTCINNGLKPDEFGHTITKPVNTNFTKGGGFRNLTDFYINGISGRKAAIINKEFMGKTGHLLNLIAIMAASVKLSQTTLDCNTVNPIPIKIKTKKHLQKMEGRRYRFSGERDYHILNPKTDENLIGETLYFRSPITCACKDGVCRECYGELYYTNIDNYSTGVFSAIEVMNPVVQGILSAKHFQSTDTSPIEFSEEFYKFFKLTATDVIINNELDNVSNLSLVIRLNNINNSEDDDEQELVYNKRKPRKKKKKNADEDEDFGAVEDYSGDNNNFELQMSYFVTSFQVAENLHDKSTKTVYHTFSEKDNKELYLDEDFISRMVAGRDDQGDYLYIDFEDINQDEFIFIVEVFNNELTKPMKQIQKLLNNLAHEGCDSYEELVNKFLDLIIEAKLGAMGIHSEVILVNLIRKASNILKRPDFERVIMRKDYQILTVNTALKNNPSITTSLSTPFLKAQLIDLTETFLKSACSVLDPYFRMTLDDNYKISGDKN